MNDPPAPVIVETFAALLLLFGAYMGAYYAMVERHMPWETEPTYRVGGHTVSWALGPAHRIDCLIRPRYWLIQPDFWGDK